jgi:hypothetical protein
VAIVILVSGKTYAGASNFLNKDRRSIVLCCSVACKIKARSKNQINKNRKINEKLKKIPTAHTQLVINLIKKALVWPRYLRSSPRYPKKIVNKTQAKGVLNFSLYSMRNGILRDGGNFFKYKNINFSGFKI